MILQTLPDLLNHLRIQTWDVVIIGDGSGSGWDIGVGWAAGLVDRYSNARKLFFGGMNCGTVTLGEIFPYLHAMVWYVSKDGPGKARRKQAAARGRCVEVHIITDSQVVVTHGSNPGSRRAHRELWASMDAYAHSGYNIHYHHVGRDVIDMNILMDEVARCAREALKNVVPTAIEKLQKAYPGLPSNVSIYDFSPTVANEQIQTQGSQQGVQAAPGPAGQCDQGPGGDAVEGDS